MARDEAQSLIVAVRAALESAQRDLVRLFRGRAWETLGYAGWAEFCAAELTDGARLEISRDERIELITGLRLAGASYRDIALGVGLPRGSVAYYLREAGATGVRESVTEALVAAGDAVADVEWPKPLADPFEAAAAPPPGRPQRGQPPAQRGQSGQRVRAVPTEPFRAVANGVIRAGQAIRLVGRLAKGDELAALALADYGDHLATLEGQVSALLTTYCAPADGS